jgi:UDP-N-acetylglucosamine--N-acetylmuramyl-(pentapeptide) pyrophosphoryl-undecaprenol N-acetylglucosamine transferase
VLVPSPNVAEDHQTKNAQALVNKDAAVMVSDVLATALLFDVALSLVHNETQLVNLSRNIAQLAQHNSANRIVDEIEKILVV